MAAALLALEDLPTQNASQVKNKWGDVARQVRESGSLAITSHSTVEMVMLSAATYRSLIDLVASAQAREKSALDELSGQFKERLAGLQHSDARARLNSLLATKGTSKSSPIAGDTF